MIVDNSVKQYKISKLPPTIMSIQNEIELANAIRNYLQISDGVRFSTLSEEQKTKEIAMYSALVKVYGNSLNMSVAPKSSSKAEFLKAGFLGGMAGAIGSSALLSSRVGIVAATSAIGGLIHSYQTVDKKQKQKIMKQIQDFDPSTMTENEASLLQYLLNPHIKDTDNSIKKMHNLIMGNSALLNTLQNKLMQYYEIKKFDSIKADVCKKALKNMQLTSGEKIVHYLKTTATTVGVSTASAYILGSITDEVKEFLSPKEAAASENQAYSPTPAPVSEIPADSPTPDPASGNSADSPAPDSASENQAYSPTPDPASGDSANSTITFASEPPSKLTDLSNIPNTRGYYGNILDSFNILGGMGEAINTFSKEGFGAALGELSKTIESQMNISNIAAKALAVAFFAYGMRSSDAHKWYARAGFGLLSMVTLGGSALISNIAKRFDFVNRRLQLGRNRIIMRYGTGVLGAAYYDIYKDRTRTTRYSNGLDALEDYLRFDADMRWNFGRLQNTAVWPRISPPLLLSPPRILGRSPLRSLRIDDMREGQSFAVRLANGSVHVFTFVRKEGGRYLFNHRANSISRNGRLYKGTNQVYFDNINPIVHVDDRYDLDGFLENIIDVKKEVSIVDIEVNNLRTDFNNIFGLFNAMRLGSYTDVNLRAIENILNDGLGGYIGLESRVNSIPDSVEKDNLKKYIQNIRIYIDVLRRFLTVRPLLINVRPPVVWPILSHIAQIRNILNGISTFGTIPTLAPVMLPTGYTDIAAQFTRFVYRPINNIITLNINKINTYLDGVFTGFTDTNIVNYARNHIDTMPDVGNTPITPKTAVAGGPVPPLNVNKGGATVDVHSDVNNLLGLGYNFGEIANILNNVGYTLPPTPPATSPTPITDAAIQSWHVS